MKSKIAILLLFFCFISLAWDVGDVVINELLWMGSTVSPYDEYLELRNMTDSTVNFRFTPWTIYRNRELMLTINDGILHPRALFLITRRDTSSSVIGVAPDLISNSLVLTNSNTYYALYAGSDSTAPLLDRADDGIGVPLSGRFDPSNNVRWSMERNDVPGDGRLAENWHVACLSVGFKTGVSERGTPKSTNYKNIPPTPPTSINISPSLITDDSSITAIAVGSYDPDNIPGDSIVIFNWLFGDSVIFTEIDSAPPFTSVLDYNRTLPGRRYRVRVFAFDGTDSSSVAYSETIYVHFEKGDIVINEVAWAGSMRSARDEWIELLNRSGKTIDFSQTPFDLVIVEFGVIPTIRTIRLDSGIVHNGGFFLISRFSRDDMECVLAVQSNVISGNLKIPNERMAIFLFECLGSHSHLIDIAGDGSSPFAGLNARADSAVYSMSRKTPPGNGMDPESWFTSEVTIGFKSGSFERGTPRSSNVRNNPPILTFVGETGFEFDAVQPDTGTKDTSFVWRVKYFDRNNTPPEYVRMFMDRNRDGDFADSLEQIDMEQENPADNDFRDGVIYRKSIRRLAHNPDGYRYTFRAKDSYARCALGIPPFVGPVVEATISLFFLSWIWRPDTFYRAGTAVTGVRDMPVFIHTGDVPIQIGLSIVQADIYEHSSDTFSFSPGGWTYGERLDTTGINLYKLSALIVPFGSVVDSSDFNDRAEDLLTSEIKWFNGDTLGRLSDGIPRNILPNDIRQIAYRLDLPERIYGFYRHWEHRITIRVYMRMPLP